MKRFASKWSKTEKIDFFLVEDLDNRVDNWQHGCWRGTFTLHSYCLLQLYVVGRIRTFSTVHNMNLRDRVFDLFFSCLICMALILGSKCGEDSCPCTSTLVQYTGTYCSRLHTFYIRMQKNWLLVPHFPGIWTINNRKQGGGFVVVKTWLGRRCLLLDLYAYSSTGNELCSEVSPGW